MRWERGIPEDKDLKMVRPYIDAPAPVGRAAPEAPPEAVAGPVVTALAECAAHGPVNADVLAHLAGGLRAQRDTNPQDALTA